ncbi:N-acetylmuramic acid 6-phosphate etherase [Paenibacillus qinlingensis]|uniref:N-acetylmuramic acid 6-phosphate etherase n=1 Tax=Paenibacillus qinlingensis TaxID=1837343 RepID=A0ABU1NVH2_9BACL|nr:N-acetylmuramic acid 6-phosphate etherase [Paenibacillus qinlingensis]MDR6550852.1 N-acetylmuramic acid 6-phosphate etherase [Paenibacillus qinlingensis]
MLDKLDELTTEMSHASALELDELDSLQLVNLMNDEDKKVALAVEQALGNIAQAIDIIHASLERGGRLFYFGAGTSGRLGVLDSSECPPTYGTASEMVQGVIAGGYNALVQAAEGEEDRPELGKEDVIKYGVKAGDVVVGIAASGRTPYVIGVLEEARAQHAKTISVSCNPRSLIDHGVHVAINVVVGPEVVTGSTRLKAATAQKMILNMLSTATMIKLGKVYGNQMVNLKASNYKLKERAKRIIMNLTGITYRESEELITRAGGDVRTAIVMQKTGLDLEKTVHLIELARGKIRTVIEQYHAQ